MITRQKRKDHRTLPSLVGEPTTYWGYHCYLSLLCLLRHRMGKENLIAHYHSLHFWLKQHSLAVGFGAEFGHIFISLEEMRNCCFGSLELKWQRTECFCLSWAAASARCPHEPLGATAVEHGKGKKRSWKQASGPTLPVMSILGEAVWEVWRVLPFTE